jgi:PST family polysaccharide transporter
MQDIRARLREWSVDRNLARNVASLYGVQFTNYILPLITIPYLTRVLGPGVWGLVAFAQAFGAYAGIGIEYGFHLSATRAVAASRESKAELANLVAGVMGAKLLLAMGAAALALLIKPWVPLFHDHPAYLWAAVFWAAAQSLSMLWYYQGVERMRPIAVLDIVGRTAATAAIFILVRRPEDGWRVLALQGCGAIFSFAVAAAVVYREIPLRLPTWRLTRNALKMGWSMFLFRSSMSLYGAGNSFILGLLAAPEAVGFYAGAEKLARALMGLLVPVHQGLYPRLSHMVRHDRPQAFRLARFSVIVMTSTGMMLSLAAFLSAPWAIPFILGKSFGASVPVLEVMAPLPLLDAVGTMLGVLWMVPLGLDRQFNKIVFVGGALNVALAIALAPRFAQIGMAAAVVSTEAFVVLSLYATLRRRKLSPLSLAHEEANLTSDGTHAA